MNIIKYISVRNFINVTAFYIRRKISEFFCIGKFIHQRLTSDIHYIHGMAEYIIRFPNKRGPCPWSSVRDQSGTDVTERVNKFAGPSHNFHGIATTPTTLGFTSLEFELRLSDDETHCHTIMFQSNDVIKF